MKRQFREPSAETRARMRSKKVGCNNPMHNKNHSEVTKRLISAKLKAYWKNIPSKNNNINNNEL